MIGIICYLCPGALSLKIKEKVDKNFKYNLKDYLLEYAKYLLIINLICFGILYVYSMGKDTSLTYSFEQFSFIFKYLVISLVVSILLPIVECYINKYLKVSVEFKEDKNEDNKKRKK